MSPSIKKYLNKLAQDNTRPPTQRIITNPAQMEKHLAQQAQAADDRYSQIRQNTLKELPNTFLKGLGLTTAGPLATGATNSIYNMLWNLRHKDLLNFLNHQQLTTSKGTQENIMNFINGLSVGDINELLDPSGTPQLPENMRSTLENVRNAKLNPYTSAVTEQAHLQSVANNTLGRKAKQDAKNKVIKQTAKVRSLNTTLHQGTGTDIPTSRKVLNTVGKIAKKPLNTIDDAFRSSGWRNKLFHSFFDSVTPVKTPDNTVQLKHKLWGPGWTRAAWASTLPGIGYTIYNALNNPALMNAKNNAEIARQRYEEFGKDLATAVSKLDDQQNQ